jgi:hypothetical protein
MDNAPIKLVTELVFIKPLGQAATGLQAATVAIPLT